MDYDMMMDYLNGGGTDQQYVLEFIETYTQDPVILEVIEKLYANRRSGVSVTRSAVSSTVSQ